MNKTALQNKSNEHQQAIEAELNALVSEGKRFAKTAAYVGGGLVASYLIVRLLTRKKVVMDDDVQNNMFRKAPAKSAGLWSGIGKIVLTEVAMLGIQFAKEQFNHILKDEDTERKTN